MREEELDSIKRRSTCNHLRCYDRSNCDGQGKLGQGENYRGLCSRYLRDKDKIGGEEK